MNDVTTVRESQAAAGGLAELLAQASVLVDDCVGDESPFSHRLTTLHERLQESRLQVAILGQFKRGKSTFINALLGAPVLPVAVVPLTAVPTFISRGPEPQVRVRFEGRPTEQFANPDPGEIQKYLFRYVAEEANPQNRLGVTRVDLFYPAPILANEVVLIDTPGVGSTFRHNTDAALGVLPQCDAVVFVTSADPPITEVELDYLRHLKSLMLRTIFILNKADYLSSEEQGRVTEFIRNVLVENKLWRSDTAIFNVSARDALLAKQSNDQSKLQASGLVAIEKHVVGKLAAEKASLLDNSVRAKAAEALYDARANIDLRMRALRMPLDELAAKSQAFDNALKSIQVQKAVLSDLLDGEKRRLRNDLESSIQALREDVSSGLMKKLDEWMLTVPDRPEAELRLWLSSALDGMFEEARENFVRVFAEKSRAAISLHRERIDELVDSVRLAAENIFQVPLGQASDDDTFELLQEPYWVTEEIKLTLIPDLNRMFDLVLPARVRRARLRRRIAGHVKELVLRNAENLRWAILRGIDETFRGIKARFEQHLEEAISVTTSAVEETMTRRRGAESSVEPEIGRLDEARAALSGIRAKLLQTDRA